MREERDSFLRFLVMAVHDLKASLVAVQSYFHVMLGGLAGELSSKQKQMLERCNLRIEELTGLIYNILDIPRIESGGIMDNTELFCIEEDIRGCVYDFRNLAQERGVEIETEIPEGLEKIYGVRPFIRRLITNIVGNGIEYATDGKVVIKVKDGADFGTVEVTDNGIGIPPAELPMIFKEFFRGSNGTFKGTGMGLAIARRIVEAHGGKI
jgi:signal transduction histidine kinase